MQAKFTVFKIGSGATVPSDLIKQKDPVGNVLPFDSESDAIQHAMANKDYYATVLVKGSQGETLLEYRGGSKV